MFIGRMFKEFGFGLILELFNLFLKSVKLIGQSLVELFICMNLMETLLMYKRRKFIYF